MTVNRTPDRTPVPPAEPPETYTDAFNAGASLGYLTGYDAGWAQGYADRSDEYTAALAGVVPVLQQPRQDELDRERAVDHGPCPSQCRRCSRCIHSIAYWARGRDYLGVNGERAATGGGTHVR